VNGQKQAVVDSVCVEILAESVNVTGLNCDSACAWSGSWLLACGKNKRKARDPWWATDAAMHYAGETRVRRSRRTVPPVIESKCSYTSHN